MAAKASRPSVVLIASYVLDWFEAIAQDHSKSRMFTDYCHIG